MISLNRFELVYTYSNERELHFNNFINEIGGFYYDRCKHQKNE